MRRMTQCSLTHPGDSNTSPEKQHWGNGGCKHSCFVWEYPSVLSYGCLKDMGALAELQAGLWEGKHPKLIQDFHSRHTFGCQHNIALLFDICIWVPSITSSFYMLASSLSYRIRLTANLTLALHSASQSLALHYDKWYLCSYLTAMRIGRIGINDSN